ncbi:MAG TPA: multidrug resistance efflux transporter family protein [Verrucomicrobiae bacterium]|nr:multidrug resistance efflux transporter family protein [Verrucomicrobiae bacterium]
MSRLLLLGMLSAAFFSSTFVLNRGMSVEGGHWFWTGSLRYAYMLVFLVAGLLCTKGRGHLAEVAGVFRRFWRFWIAAGSVGFGIFYALLAFSASYAPGWIIATTWQVTILATPAVLLVFGKRVPVRGLLLTGLIFSGIVLVNLAHAGTATAVEVLFGVLPVLGAAFAYPLGNQMVWEATQHGSRLIPRIEHPVMQDPFSRILLLTAGSVPFWLLLFPLVSPPPPSPGQLVSTAIVALLSGVVATAIFFHARHLCVHPYELAAVDATQSMEVVFSLAGEIIFLGGTFPTPLGIAGIAVTIIGLTAYTRQHYAG